MMQTIMNVEIIMMLTFDLAMKILEVVWLMLYYQTFLL
jgi:hypothetical protein